MTRRAGLVLSAATVAAVVTGGLAPTSPAAASSFAASRTAGPQAFDGYLVKAAGKVVATKIFARGVFDGVGQIVEVHSRPGDPDNVNRDDLVFRAGAMHIVSTNHDVKVSLDPHTCTVRAHLSQTSKVTGGTGRFRGASGSFVASVDALGVAARGSDGKCTMARELLTETDLVSARGRLSF